MRPAAHAREVAVRIATNGDPLLPRVSDDPAPEVRVAVAEWELSWLAGSDELTLVAADRVFIWRLASIDPATVAGWFVWIGRAVAEERFAVGTFRSTPGGGLEAATAPDTLIWLRAAPGATWGPQDLVDIGECPEPPGTPALGWPEGADGPANAVIAWLDRDGQLSAPGQRCFPILLERASDGSAIWRAIDEPTTRESLDHVLDEELPRYRQALRRLGL